MFSGDSLQRYRYSLLHATYRREESPLHLRTAWLSAAAEPETVEHVFAMDEDDVASVRATAGYRRVVSPPTEGVTAVRNWNAAAAAATGDVLLVIADDLYPPRHWDATLSAIIGSRLEPDRDPFTVKVLDEHRSQDRHRDTLMRHPVVSRAFFEKFGLFSPEFSGIGCDVDITRRALWGSVILDGRRLALEHRRPPHDRPSESTSKLNDPSEYERAERIYHAKWTPRQRAARVRLMPTDVIPPTPTVLRLARPGNAALAAVAYATHGIRTMSWRPLQFRPRSSELLDQRRTPW